MNSKARSIIKLALLESIFIIVGVYFIVAKNDFNTGIIIVLAGIFGCLPLYIKIISNLKNEKDE